MEIQGCLHLDSYSGVLLLILVYYCHSEKHLHIQKLGMSSMSVTLNIHLHAITNLEYLHTGVNTYELEILVLILMN